MTATDVVNIDPANAAQLAAWNGDEGAYWADHADHFDHSVAAYHPLLLDAAAIAPTDRVLDIGCGTGQTTLDAARSATDGGSVLGVDLSARMLDIARRRLMEAGAANATFEQADAQVHPFVPGSFDAAISRTGTMFFADLSMAFTNIARALAPAGRLTMLVWQPLAANEWLQAISGALAAGRELPPPPSDAPGPFSLSEPDRVRGILTSAGLTDVALEGVRADMWFGADADDAHRFVLGLMGWMLQGLDDAGRARALEALRTTMAAHQTGSGVVFGSAAWIITATRSAR
jgi:SAM-dependent methyltransferase